DATLHEDEDQIALGKNLFNKETATVLKVVDGSVEPHIVEFGATSVGKTGKTYKLSSVEGSYKDGNPSGAFAETIINGDKNQRFPRGGTIGLKWTVAGLASDTVVELAILPMDYVASTKDKMTAPENPPDDGHVLDDPAQNPRDVTSWTTDGSGAAVFRDQGAYSFYCDLRLKDGSGKVLHSQTICAAVDAPLPVLNSFSLADTAITPDTQLLGIKVSTSNADGVSLWIVTSKSDGTVIENLKIADHGAKKDAIDKSVDIDISRYPVEATVNVQCALFGLSHADGGPVTGDSSKNADPWKISGEGLLADKPSARQQLKITWSVDKTGAVWLKTGDPDKWQWQVYGRADSAAMLGHGSFTDSRVPFSQLQSVSGGMRLSLSGGDPGPFDASRGFQDKGHYLVKTAAKDGTPDDSTLLVAGQLGPFQPDVLRTIPKPGDDNIAISLTDYQADRKGAGFGSIKHFFVLMLENRSFDHMFGHIFPKADGTLNPDGSERDDCYSYACKPNPDNSNIQETSEKVHAAAGASDQMIIDPGHEFSNVHYGLYGWGDSGPANRTDLPDMHGFIGPYLNRLIPRTENQGQWDGDALASHNYRFSTLGGNWAAGGVLVPAAWPVTAYAALKTKDTILEALGGADPVAVSKAVMLGFAANDIPAFSGLASKYALCDRWFSALPGPTWPNRLFVHCGTSGGLDDSPGAVSSAWKAKIGNYELTNVYDVMANHGCEWMIFAWGSTAQAETIDLKTKLHNSYSASFRRVVTGDANFKAFEQFIDSYNHVDKGSITFLEPDYGDLGVNSALQNNLAAAFLHGNSQHPISGARSGDDLIKRVVEILKSNTSVWQQSCLIVTHDEHGGFYDHVPPPNAIPPGDTDQYSNVQNGLGSAGKRSTPGLTGAFDFARYGVRVPAVIISPRIPSGVVDHTVYDHTSVARTVRKAFGIDASLSKREDSANDFSHLFTLQTPRTD
ncbi:MAG TPA: alkaline phosphatase family protein, partial [Myxococcales bacterium]|nr:alkaline phosphatase family protein [Myxococcales bacterium]